MHFLGLARARPARSTAALVAAALLGASCSTHQEGGDQDPGSEPTQSQPGSGSPAPTGAALPATPSTDDPRALAAEVERAAATLRDGSATAGEQRRAGELLQLAVRALAAGQPAMLPRVTARLRPETAMVVRLDVRSSRLLGGITAPQPHLPPWRIVAPAPAGELLRDYRAAQRRTGVPWTYLAAIHLVETRMGRIRGESTAGAQGPMQFVPATWEMYGAGGDINDPHDAIMAAARLLSANGAPRDMPGALWHYNQSHSYVRAVTGYARTLQRAPWAYRGYWSWRVLYSQERGTYVLPVGYPHERAVLLPDG